MFLMLQPILRYLFLVEKKIQKYILDKHQYVIQDDEYDENKVSQRLDKECKKVICCPELYIYIYIDLIYFIRD